MVEKIYKIFTMQLAILKTYMKQSKDESIDQFFLWPKQKAQRCRFEDADRKKKIKLYSTAVLIVNEGKHYEMI